MKEIRIVKTLTDRSENSLGKYLFEVNAEEQITREEEAELSIKIQNGDQQALDRLVKANLRFVVSVAKQHQRRGTSLSDLINEGNIGLIQAAKRFDGSKGFKFISYAVWYIRNNIMKSSADQIDFIKAPSKHNTQVNKTNRVSLMLEQQLERKPTTEELSVAMNLSKEKMLESMNLTQRLVSLDSPIGAETETTLIDVLENKNVSSSDEKPINESLTIEVQRSLNSLEAREKLVLEMFFGINMPEALDYKKIGLKLGINSSRVAEIKNRAILRLRHISRSKTLLSYA